MPNIIKNCATCGNEFQATCGAARFCSDQCQFDANADKSGDCWLWTGPKDKDGYGYAKLRGRRVEKAHRLAFRLYRTNVPDGMLVCHSCDNPACCNPEHLFLGTALDNKTDSVAKDRHVRGEKLYWKAKLTESDVLAIRDDKRSSYDIAAEYGVTATLVQSIWKRKIWKHV